MIAGEKFEHVQVGDFHPKRFKATLPDSFIVRGQRGNHGAQKIRVPAVEVDRSYGIACDAFPECFS